MRRIASAFAAIWFLSGCAHFPCDVAPYPRPKCAPGIVAIMEKIRKGENISKEEAIDLYECLELNQKCPCWH